MSQYRKCIYQLVSQIVPVCKNWIETHDDGQTYFIDPIDKVEISAHYGATHVSAAFILLGTIEKDAEIYNTGIKLLRSVLSRWNANEDLPGFHHDFNNFALLLIYDSVDAELSAQIKRTVLSTRDSNHDTVNWLPMRWLVNKKRKKWESKDKYRRNIEYCKKIILQATNADGGIEDRLPYGTSYSLQYNIATVALLQYLRTSGEDMNLDKQLGFLLNAVIPDGDINYIGRGTNQIFAWGMWLYLLASSAQYDHLENALRYLSCTFPTMSSHHSLMLNEWDGNDKFLWWDYHYESVYTAHFLLWLVLAYRDIGKAEIHPVKPHTAETGIHVVHSSKTHVVWFEGRNEYLAEKGPSVSAIWINKSGTLFKGAFGPWQGSFGNNWIYEYAVMINYCGLFEVKRNKDWSKVWHINKIFPNLESRTSLTVKPVFCPLTIREIDNVLEIAWLYDGNSEVIFNFPCSSQIQDMELEVDDDNIHLECVGTVKNQYGWQWLYQSHSMKGKRFLLRMYV